MEMQRFWCQQQLLVLVMLVFNTSCDASLGRPDWKTLYTRKLGQPLVKLHEASLNQAFQDSQGNVTRVSWANLADGTTVLLGLPAYQNPPQEVVDRTVVLSQSRWQDACQSAVGKKMRGWGQSFVSNAVTNQVDIYISTKPPTKGTQSVQLPDPSEPICQFAFLSGGWQLRLVYNKGQINP